MVSVLRKKRGASKDFVFSGVKDEGSIDLSVVVLILPDHKPVTHTHTHTTF